MSVSDKSDDIANTPDMPMQGGRTAVFRRGLVVHRETGKWASTVHLLLRHLEKVGFDAAPRVVGSGFDKQCRETLSFMPGEIIPPGPWQEAALPRLGKMLKDLHAATATFVLPVSATWRDWFGRSLGNPALAIGHCDTGPWNIVTQNGQPVALIDWEVAGPVDPLYELAQLGWLNAKLYDDEVAEIEQLPPLNDRARHLSLILDGYELPRVDRRNFIDKVIEFAIQDAANEVIEAGIAPDMQHSTSLWGISWRTRSAAWILRYRSTLQQAVL